MTLGCFFSLFLGEYMSFFGPRDVFGPSESSDHGRFAICFGQETIYWFVPY